jgi:hypothetical protein
MRLLLQQRPDGREAPRFVQLMLEPDLLGGWALVRETGRSADAARCGASNTWTRPAHRPPSSTHAMRS